MSEKADGQDAGIITIRTGRSSSIGAIHMSGPPHTPERVRKRRGGVGRGMDRGSGVEGIRRRCMVFVCNIDVGY